MNALREPLRDLGAQHVHWGARPEDYVIAREALVAAIGGRSPRQDQTLGRHWRHAVTAIIVPMLEGAAVHTLPRWRRKWPWMIRNRVDFGPQHE
jgi:hypothetical protein